MIRSLKALVAVLAISTGLGMSVAHADPAGFYGGANIGILDVDSEGLDSGLTYGLRGGVALDSKIAVGLNVNLFADKANVGTGRIETNITSILAEAAYYFDVTSRGWYVGPRLGFVNASTDSTDPLTGQDVTVDQSGLGLGVFGGYSYVISDQFTLSGDLGITQVFADDSFSLVQAIVSGSFWF